MENRKSVSNLYNHHVKFVDKESKKVKSCLDPEEAKVAVEVVVVVVVVEGLTTAMVTTTAVKITAVQITVSSRSGERHLKVRKPQLLKLNVKSFQLKSFLSSINSDIFNIYL